MFSVFSGIFLIINLKAIESLLSNNLDSLIFHKLKRQWNRLNDMLDTRLNDWMIRIERYLRRVA